MITENLSTLKIHKLSKEQYDRELAAGRIDPNALYLTPDEETDLSLYATKEELASKADVEHNHNDSYYTKDELDPVMAEVTSNINELDGLINETASTAANNLMQHNQDSDAHSDIRNLISELSTKVNNFLDVDDTTSDQLSEVLTLIENNKGTLESLTSGKVNVSDIVDNLTTSDSSKVLSAKQGVELKALIDTLQGVVDGKVDANHTHDDRYYTEVEIDSKIDDLNSTISGKADSGHIHTVADASNDGFMSAAMVGKLEGIEENANKTIVDSALSTTSANPVANNAVTSALNTATEAIGLNTQSITAHTQSINTLQEEFDSIQEITSQEIQDLFRA